MSDLTAVHSNKTMLSMVIAELTSKLHKNVIRDIEVIIEQMTGSNLSFLAKSTTYTADNGIPYKCYELDYEATMVVVTGYDVVARAKVIKRWMELEALAAKPLDLNDPAALRGMLLSYTEKVTVLLDKIDVQVGTLALQAPKVEAFEKLSGSDGSLNITNAAKTLNVPPKKMFDALSQLKWIFRRAGGSSWIAYQDKIQTGYLEHKVTTISRSDGTDKITEQVRVTPKGLTKLASLALN